MRIPRLRYPESVRDNLHSTDAELSQGSDHLGARVRVVTSRGDNLERCTVAPSTVFWKTPENRKLKAHLDHKRVVVGRDDGSSVGGGRVETDTHALSGAEHLHRQSISYSETGDHQKLERPLNKPRFFQSPAGIPWPGLPWSLCTGWLSRGERFPPAIISILSHPPSLP